MRPLVLAIKVFLCAFPLPGIEERVWLTAAESPWCL